MSKILQQAQEFEKQSKRTSLAIAKSVNHEYDRLDDYIKRRISKSQSTIENAISQNEQSYQNQLSESIRSYEKTLSKVQRRAVLIFSSGLIVGMSILLTTAVLLHGFKIINFGTG